MKQQGAAHRLWRTLKTLRWALLALVAGTGGGVLLLTTGDDNASGSRFVTATPEQGATPWYQAQTPPPVLPNMPDAPLRLEQKARVTNNPAPMPPPAPAPAPAPVPAVAPAPAIPPTPTYEEALPRDVYVPPPANAEAIEGVDDEAAWRRHAVAAPVSDGRPRLAIVIDDMGVDYTRSPKAITLPGPLTLSFLPYAHDIETQTAAAHAAGHELLLHVSMEPESKAVDPGPNVLQVGDSAAEIRKRFQWGLSRFQGYVGINNHMGSRFTEDADGMTVVMEELKKRGLLYLDSRTTPHTVGRTLALEAGVPVLERNIFLDNIDDEAEILKRLEEAERFARRHGRAIAIGHPKAATIKVLSEQLSQLAARGIQLVPLTALLESR